MQFRPVDKVYLATNLFARFHPALNTKPLGFIRVGREFVYKKIAFDLLDCTFIQCGSSVGAGRRTPAEWRPRQVTGNKWSGGESNSRPLHCERSALPTELPPQNDRLSISATFPRVSPSPDGKTCKAKLLLANTLAHVAQAVITCHVRILLC